MFRITQEIPDPGSKEQLHRYYKVLIMTVSAEFTKKLAFFFFHFAGSQLNCHPALTQTSSDCYE